MLFPLPLGPVRAWGEGISVQGLTGLISAWWLPPSRPTPHGQAAGIRPRHLRVEGSQLGWAGVPFAPAWRHAGASDPCPNPSRCLTHDRHALAGVCNQGDSLEHLPPLLAAVAKPHIPQL